jgi:signal transduction histidine kinase/CheY-like chemotaxis protein
VASDITQRSQAAAQLHQQLEQTGQRLAQESTQHQQTAEALKSTQAQLLQAQKMEIIGNLASGVAHDFNNILTAIMGYATLLWSEAEGTTQEYAAEILQAAERAATLSKQLLGFGRVQPNDPKIIALEPVIRNVEGMLRRVIGDTISLRTAIERNVGTVRADPSQIEQLLLNLVVNARDAMPTGGRITIALRQRSGQRSSPNDGENSSDWVELSVTDEGTGIPPEVQRRMFEPFFTTKRPGQGTGLGLATCEMIAQQNNGRLEFTTAAAKGTTFILRLPCVGAPGPPARPVSADQTNAPGRGTLLVVEDEPAVGEIIALLLRDLGYKVLTAENGEAAERVIAGCAHEIDLIVTDLNMPRMNGRELLARLSRNNPRVRVILTSGSEELLDDAMTESLEIDFLPKPFSRQGLVEKVRAVLAK